MLLKENFTYLNVIMQELFTEATQGNLITGKIISKISK